MKVAAFWNWNASGSRVRQSPTKIAGCQIMRSNRKGMSGVRPLNNANWTPAGSYFRTGHCDQHMEMLLMYFTGARCKLLPWILLTWNRRRKIGDDRGIGSTTRANHEGLFSGCVNLCFWNSLYGWKTLPRWRSEFPYARPTFAPLHEFCWECLFLPTKPLDTLFKSLSEKTPPTVNSFRSRVLGK